MGLSIDLTGIVSNDDVSATATSYTYDNANVGTGKAITASGITLTGAKAGNYTLKNNTATATGSITQATISGALTISGTAAYGQELTASYAPSNGETVSYQWNRDGTAINGASGVPIP